MKHTFIGVGQRRPNPYPHCFPPSSSLLCVATRAVVVVVVVVVSNCVVLLSTVHLFGPVRTAVRPLLTFARTGTEQNRTFGSVQPVPVLCISSEPNFGNTIPRRHQRCET